MLVSEGDGDTYLYLGEVWHLFHRPAVAKVEIQVVALFVKLDVLYHECILDKTLDGFLKGPSH